MRITLVQLWFVCKDKENSRRKIPCSKSYKSTDRTSQSCQEPHTEKQWFSNHTVVLWRLRTECCEVNVVKCIFWSERWPPHTHHTESEKLRVREEVNNWAEPNCSLHCCIAAQLLALYCSLAMKRFFMNQNIAYLLPSAEYSRCTTQLLSFSIGAC